ncbi:hypothetical protein B4U81_08145 [Vibrio campbellii]|nr:hypothetical protein B4U81_08145 [Vibrio campbellii]
METFTVDLVTIVTAQSLSKSCQHPVGAQKYSTFEILPQLTARIFAIAMSQIYRTIFTVVPPDNHFTMSMPLP